MIAPRLRCGLPLGTLLLILGGLAGRVPPAGSIREGFKVEYAGCSQVVFPGPVCALSSEERALQLWVYLDAEANVEIGAGGQRWRRVEPAPAGAYTFMVRNISARASSLVVRISQANGNASWSLALTADRRPRLVIQADHLKGSKDRVKWKQAKKLLESGIANLGAADRGFAWSLLAQVDHNLGDVAGARRSLARSIPLHHAAGLVLDEAMDSGLLAWLEIQRRDFSAARKGLSEVDLPPGSPAEAIYSLHYHLGLLAEQVGDSRSALYELKEAAEQARRVGLIRNSFDAEQVLARQLQALGRSRDAANVFDRLNKTPMEAVGECDWAEMRVNQAWSLLLAGEAGESRPDPVPVLEEAEATSRRANCPRSAGGRLNYLLNLTLAYLQAQDTSTARKWLKEVAPLLDSARPLDRLWLPELEARLALQDRNFNSALMWYQELGRLAMGLASPEGLWRAEYGQAECYVKLHHTNDALAASRRAEELLDKQSLQVPMNEGRETFVAQREGATRLYLLLLLDTGRNSEALEVTRRARSRFLRELARGDGMAHLTGPKQEKWDRALGVYWARRAESDRLAGESRGLPTDQERSKGLEVSRIDKEARRGLDYAFVDLGSVVNTAKLPPVRPGELVLAFHPLRVGWVGFAADGYRVSVHRFELAESDLERPAALATRLLVPFRKQIQMARRIRVLPYGILRSVDFHALPFGGQGHILLEQSPIAYGLDVASAPARPAPETRARHALLVANPTWGRRDLPAAEVEARSVAEVLEAESSGWSVSYLEKADATAEAVRAALPGVELLHYAGHGSYSGLGGWESDLPLAKDTKLTLSDLLVLKRVPRWVVLSGCDTGKAGEQAPMEGLNLAYAFILGGAEQVVAATRPVGDWASQQLLSQLYSGWNRAPDLAAHLRNAQLAAWRSGAPASGWAAFRAFEP